ncbi:hypothetical protein KNE206_22910 [Kitasatospora sp. NE20-6]|uniref:LuxR C-terminal-related transcriptional regulator n=1 Tax=Kitasatospora sp. NE20-6 TaxID=2859066 RepID=UPI0034DBCCD9
MTAPSKAHRAEEEPAGEPARGPSRQARDDAARLLARLTRREAQVLARFTAGDDTRAAAAALGIAPATVRNHLQRAMRKLGVESREDAVRLSALLAAPGAAPAAAPGEDAVPDGRADPAGEPEAAVEPEAREPEAAAAPDRPEAPAVPAPPAAPEPPGTAAAVPDFAVFSAAVHTRLVQQTYLLTGSPQRASRIVRAVLGDAALQWDEVSALPDPEGQVRAAAFEAALSPWHRGRSRPTGPDAALLAALGRLSRPQRRAVVLHDAVGLPAPVLAAEAESTTAAAERRVLAARAELARTVPQVVGADPLAPDFGPGLGSLLHDAAVRACPPVPAPAPGRLVSDALRRTRTTTVAAGLLVLAVGGAVIATLVTAGGSPAPARAPQVAVAPPPQVCSSAGTGSAGPALPGRTAGLRSPWCSPVPPEQQAAPPAARDGQDGDGG